MGVAKGIFPGRVVWVHDSSAVNQNCVVNKSGHGWFMSENMNQPVVDSMLSVALQNISGTTNDSTGMNLPFSNFTTITITRGELIMRPAKRFLLKSMQQAHGVEILTHQT